MKKSLHRGLVATATAVALAGAAVAVPTSAQADVADTTGAWLAGELDAGLLPGQFGSPDYGLSVDALLSLDVLGVQAGAIGDIADALAKDPQAYISGEAFGDGGSTYAGATGKLAVGAAAAGRDAEDFGGVDLLERLRGTIATEGEEAGRASDVSDFGDYSNTLGQTFVVRALVDAGDDLALDAIDYLLKQQCADGSFRIGMFAEAVPDDPETEWDDSIAPVDRECGDQTTKGDDTISYDATALAVTALVEAEDAGIDGLGDAIDDGAAALADAQASDGSLQDDGVANANTTGLAALALADAGDLDAATAAAEFVATLRVPDDASGALADERGAIAFDQAAFDAAQTAGLPESRDQWRRATAQAAGALALLPDSATLTVTTATDGFAGTGQDVGVVVEGLEVGEPVTVTAGDDVAKGAADDDGRAELDVTMPSAAGTVSIDAQGGSPERTGSTSVQVLAPATFELGAPASVEAGESFALDVDGLVDGEGYEAAFEQGASGDAAPAARALPSGGTGSLATLAVSGVVAPEEPGEYTLSVVSTVPERSGSTTLTVVAADAGPGAGGDGSEGSEGAGSSDGGATDTGSLLPSAGTTVSLVVVAAALLAVLLGAVLTLRRRRAEGGA